MYLVSIFGYNEKDVEGICYDDEYYFHFYVEVDGDFVIGEKVEKSQYRNYEHYANVFNKFEPDVSFFLTPIFVDEESYNGILEAFQKHIQIDVEGVR